LVDRTILLSNLAFYNKNIELIIEILKDNGYLLGMIFNYINKRIKSLAIKKSTMTHNNTSSDFVDMDGVVRNLIVFPYIKSIFNKITKSIN